MENIIHNFIYNVTNFFNLSSFDFNSIVENAYEFSKKFSLDILKFLIETLDDEIRLSKSRKKKWYVERYDTRTILTPLGKLTFTRTYYKHKHIKNKYSYLLDEALGINKYQRMDVSIEAKLLEFANELSYEKAGKMFNENFNLSKQTVKNKIKKFSQIEFSEEIPEKKKQIKYLYIDADEDHVSLQNGKNKINKLIYVYENKIKESKGRNILINKKYFSSVKKSGEDLWLEVLDYIDKTYDTEYIEKIFIQGDGARWIKSGVSWIEKSIHVIDKFHLNKAIMKVCGGNLKEGIGKVLKEVIYTKDEEGFKRLSKEILEKEQDEKRREKKKRELGYIKNQKKGIKEFLKYKEKLGCSAEGHVSHVLSSKLSSRPKGWSIEGLEERTKLIIFKVNGGTEKELKEGLKKINKKIPRRKNKKEEEKLKRQLGKRTGEILGNIPSIKKGQVNGTYRKIKGIA